MIFESFLTPLLFDDYREFQEEKHCFQQGWKSAKTILKVSIFCHFPRSTTTWSGTLIPFKSMSTTLRITFLFFEVPKKCFAIPELFPKR